MFTLNVHSFNNDEKNELKNFRCIRHVGKVLTICLFTEIYLNYQQTLKKPNISDADLIT